MAKHRMPIIGLPVAIPDISAWSGTGVYFLFKEGVCVYVGKAVDMRRRIGEHISAGSKDFDAVFCAHCSASRMNGIEAHFISMLIPKYNQCSRAKYARIGPAPLVYSTKRQRRRLERYPKSEATNDAGTGTPA